MSFRKQSWNCISKVDLFSGTLPFLNMHTNSEVKNTTLMKRHRNLTSKCSDVQFHIQWPQITFPRKDSGVFPCPPSSSLFEDHGIDNYEIVPDLLSVLG